MIRIGSLRQADWHTVTLESGDTFQVQIKPPTFQEQLEDSETIKGYAERRLKTSLVGWSDVADESGEPVVFSMESFALLCNSQQEVLRQVLRLVHDAYNGRGETAVKNSPPLPVEPSQDEETVSDAPLLSDLSA